MSPHRRRHGSAAAMEPPKKRIRRAYEQSLADMEAAETLLSLSAAPVIFPPPLPPKKAILRRERLKKAKEAAARVFVELFKHQPMVYVESEGKKTQGFMHRFNRGNPVFVCACHGRFWSAGEFVQHAVGYPVDQPDQRIMFELFTM